jgi:hypothetical protein
MTWQPPRAWQSPLLLLWWELTGLSYLAAPLPQPSVESVAPQSPGTSSETAFVLLFLMLILFHLDSSSCSVSPSNRTPTPVADQTVGSAMGHGPQAAYFGGAPTRDKDAAALKAPEAATGDGSPAPIPDTTAAMAMTAATLIGSSVGASSPQPQMGAAFTSAVAGDDIAEEPEVIHGHPLLRAPRGISLDEAMGTAQWALNQAQEVLRRERGDVDDKRQHVLLWASMLKDQTISKKVREQASERHLNTREELLKRQRASINELNAASYKILSDAKELYTTVEAWANTTIKQEEELIVHIHAVSEREQVVEELE